MTRQTPTSTPTIPNPSIPAAAAASSSSLSSNSSHSFVLVSSSDSLNNYNNNQLSHHPHPHPHSPSKFNHSSSSSSSAPQTKENQHPFPSASSFSSPNLDQSASKPSNQVKGNTRSYKQIMRPVSPDHHNPRSAHGNRNRSRSRSRKVSSVVIESKEWEKIYKQQTSSEVEEEFESMLTTLEIPPALRVKLIAMDPTVKASMLRGQATLNLSSLADACGTESGETSRARSRSPSKSNINPNARGAIPFKGIRKSKSSSSLAAEEIHQHDKRADKPNQPNDDDQLFVAPKRKSLFGSSNRSASGGNSSVSSGSNSHLPLSNSPDKNKSNLSINQAQQSSPTKNGTNKSRIRATSFGKDVLTPSSFRESPLSFATLLSNTSSPKLPISSLKRLRVLLSTESPTWLGEFISNGGYKGLIERLDEIFEMEWREDVRDDEVLHELFRGLNALASTPKGKSALSDDKTFPQPFVKMIDLLFSEKRPGDISTRRLMVELMISMNDLTISKPLKSGTTYSDEANDRRTGEEGDPYSSIINSRVPSSSFSLARLSFDPKKSTAFLILLLLLHNPRTPTQESLLSFVKKAHAQRPFKTYLTEVAGTCRDYFWIFCHSQNRFWRLDDVDVKEVEGPKVPGGMTGGVEFEAMGYLTTHMKLINTVASRLHEACDGKRGAESMAAYEFHQMLFASGWERILTTIRRSSQVYYAPLHLELARYFHLASLCHFQVPANLSVWFATPLARKGLAPSLSQQMIAANLKNERGTPHAITPIPCTNDSPQIHDLPRMEPLNMSMDQTKTPVSPPTRQASHPPVQTEKVRRELPTVPNQQASLQAKEVRNSPSTTSPVKSSKSPQIKSPPAEASSTFSPSSKGLEQPFSSGRWMSNGKALGGLSSTPPKSPAPRSKSPERRNQIRTDSVDGSTQKLTSPIPKSPAKRVASSTQRSPQPSPRQPSNENFVNSSPTSIGSPLPNPFDRFYSISSNPQPISQPLSPQNQSQNVISPRLTQTENSFFAKEMEMGPSLPKRGAQDSVVGTAIKRWEMRAQEVVPTTQVPTRSREYSTSSNDSSNSNRLPAGTGLGLGWAANGSARS